MELEEKIAKWERITMRLAGFIAVVLILSIVIVYSAIEGVRFLIERFSH